MASIATVTLIILPGIFLVFGTYIGVTYINKLQPSHREALVSSSAPVYLLGLYVVTGIYGLMPARYSTEKYFKKRGFERAIIEFEYVKKIVAVEISILGLTLILNYSIFYRMSDPESFFNLLTFAALFLVVPGGFLRLILLIARKEFRFYFAKGCFSIMTQKEEDLAKMRYLKLGLESYNKFLRRHLKYQIGESNIKKFYFKYMRAAIQERNEMVNSLLQAFEDGKTRPATCVATITKVPEIEEFLIEESVGQKLKVVGTFLASSHSYINFGN